MDTSRPTMTESRALARIEEKIDRVLDLTIEIRYDLVDLRAELRLRDATTARVVEVQRRTLARLRRLVRSIHGDGDGGPSGWGRE